MSRVAAVAVTLLVSATTWAGVGRQGERVKAGQDVEAVAHESNGPHENRLPRSLEHIVEAVSADLRGQGFDVARGYWKLFGTEECKWAIHVYGNCQGNNPTAPYIVPAVPPWPDEYVDRSTHIAFGPVQHGDAVTYRLSEREALVILARLPPPGAYFGVQTYVFTRRDAIDPLDEVYRRIQVVAPEFLELLFAPAPDPSRVMMFSSVGDANNHVVMSEPGHPPWDQDRFIVITPNASMTDVVKRALVRADEDAKVFFEPVSPDLVRLGAGANADELLTVARYAMPDDEVLGEAWREDLPMAVLRVRDLNAPDEPLVPYVPYGTPSYDPRSAESEQALQPELDALVQAVKDDWVAERRATQPGCDARFIVPYLDIDLVGQHCLPRPMNCLGDTMDTDTYRTSPSFTIDPPGTTVAVVGTLATTTGNATYVSVSVNRFDVLEGVQNLSQDKLHGSASRFGASDKLYAFYLARRCREGLRAPCVEVSEREVPTGHVVKIMQRNYIKPGTARGADPGTPDDLSTPEDERIGHELLLRPRLIWLDPTACPNTP